MCRLAESLDAPDRQYQPSALHPHLYKLVLRLQGPLPSEWFSNGAFPELRQLVISDAPLDGPLQSPPQGGVSGRLPDVTSGALLRLQVRRLWDGSKDSESNRPAAILSAHAASDVRLLGEPRVRVCRPTVPNVALAASCLTSPAASAGEERGRLSRIRMTSWFCHSPGVCRFCTCHLSCGSTLFAHGTAVTCQVTLD